MTGTVDLRERRRLATVAEIEAVALDLFDERGSERTTVEEIAAAAGVSQRTFFRYFPTKEDAALGVNRTFQEAFSGQLAEGKDVFEAVAAALAGLRTRPGAVERLLRVRRLLAQDENLRRAALAFDAEACHANQRLIEGGPLRARVVIETVSVALRAALDEWARRRHDGEDADLLEIFREACGYQKAM
ncbi:TetR family transcriptional regulator [Actinoplanes sp. NPDC049596]|uniref:TetR family transcriptional regulator n=1 Tax=unclassified Actinoplanes TaxID=2626549 RepID=UPI003434DA23